MTEEQKKSEPETQKESEKKPDQAKPSKDHFSRTELEADKAQLMKERELCIGQLNQINGAIMMLDRKLNPPKIDPKQQQAQNAMQLKQFLSKKKKRR